MIKYRDMRPYRFQLMEDYHIRTGIVPAGLPIDLDYISLDIDGVLTIRKGYCWDGASGPAINTKNFRRGSLVHDALFQLMRMGLLPEIRRKAADLLLYHICREDGMSAVRASWVYAAVRAFGWAGTANPGLEDWAYKVKTAP